jgi:hypothetical protein
MLVEMALPFRGQTKTRDSSSERVYHGRFKEWMRHFHGVATKNLPSYLSWRRTIERLGAASDPEAWIMGAAGMGPYLQTSR